MRGGVVRRYMYILFVLHVGFFVCVTVWCIMLHLCIQLYGLCASMELFSPYLSL